MTRLIFFIVLIVSIRFVCSSRNQALSSLTDEEYEILLRKILGIFDAPVSDRTTVGKSILRKYCRWKKEGRELHIGPH